MFTGNLIQVRYQTRRRLAISGSRKATKLKRKIDRRLAIGEIEGQSSGQGPGGQAMKDSDQATDPPTTSNSSRNPLRNY